MPVSKIKTHNEIAGYMLIICYVADYCDGRRYVIYISMAEMYTYSKHFEEVGDHWLFSAAKTTGSCSEAV